MTAFASGSSSAPSGVVAIREAISSALSGLGSSTPKLAIVFASVTYPELEAMLGAAREHLGAIPIVGGSAGQAVVGPRGHSKRGVSVTILGGDGVEVAVEEAGIASADLLDTVTAGQVIARAADTASRNGHAYYTCLAFAPGVLVDGELFVAAVRKGAGARAQLAGCLTGDDMTMNNTRVIAKNGFRSDRIVLAGVFTKKPVGIAARHGFREAGPVRTVTRMDGRKLLALDGEHALDIWQADAREFGAMPAGDPSSLSVYLGIVDAGHSANATESGSWPGAPVSPRELVARAPIAIGADRSVSLSASIPEGTQLRVLRGSNADLLAASETAAQIAVSRAGGDIAGALVFPCAGRLLALGEEFAAELEGVRKQVNAPVGGGCVFGEVARNVRDVDAFFNTTIVVVAFAR